MSGCTPCDRAKKRERGWFGRCVKKVRASGSAENPAAVCGAILRKKRQGMAKKKKGGKRVCYTVHVTKKGKFTKKKTGKTRRICRKK